LIITITSLSAVAVDCPAGSSARLVDKLLFVRPGQALSHPAYGSVHFLKCQSSNLCHSSCFMIRGSTVITSIVRLVEFSRNYWFQFFKYFGFEKKKSEESNQLFQKFFLKPAIFTRELVKNS
jgi:hypothetical protein